MVSFASGGDAETLDFVCYVAKNDQGQRMCYVFEGLGGLAQDVIMTLGQAFRLGYQVNPLPCYIALENANIRLKRLHQFII